MSEDLIPELGSKENPFRRGVAKVRAWFLHVWNDVLSTNPRKFAALAVLALVAAGLTWVARPRTVIEPTGEATGSRVSISTTTTTAPPTTIKPKPAPNPSVTSAPVTVAVTAPSGPPPATLEPPPVPVSNEEDGPIGQPVTDTGPEPWPQGCCAPLTGLGFDDPGFANRAALAVKINNSPEADPHTNLYRADQIFELRVEGVSRFIAVFHSRAIGVVGPIRSGRTSDPPILRAFGTPLVAYSGGNQTVYDTFRAAEANGWLINVATKWASNAYFRTTDRKLPHNYYAHSEVLWGARGGASIPLPQFDFLAAGESNPTAVQGTIVKTRVGSVNSEFAWDPASGMYLRSQRGRAHLDKETGHRMARESVIVLKTKYGTSSADARSPEAITTWDTGEAWVFTNGTYVHGRWARQETDSRFTLVDDNERGIKLSPGPVWVTLTDVSPTFG